MLEFGAWIQENSVAIIVGLVAFIVLALFLNKWNTVEMEEEQPEMVAEKKSKRVRKSKA